MKLLFTYSTLISGITSSDEGVVHGLASYFSVDATQRLQTTDYAKFKNAHNQLTASLFNRYILSDIPSIDYPHKKDITGTFDGGRSPTNNVRIYIDVQHDMVYVVFNNKPTTSNLKIDLLKLLIQAYIEETGHKLLSDELKVARNLLLETLVTH